MICKLNFIVLFLSSILITNTGNAQAGSSPSRTETKTARAFYTASNQSHGPMDATVTLEYSFFREYIGGKYFLGISIHYKNMEYSSNYGGYRFKLNGKIYTQQELQSYDSRGVECFTDVIIDRVTIRDLGITGVSKKITYSGAINRFDGLVEISKTQDLNNFSLITATSTCPDIGYKQNVDCVSKRINDFEKGVKNASDYKIAIQKADQAFLSKDWTTARQYYRQASAMFPNENYPIDQLEKIKQKEVDLATQNAQNTSTSGSNTSSSGSNTSGSSSSNSSSGSSSNGSSAGNNSGGSSNSDSNNPITNTTTSNVPETKANPVQIPDSYKGNPMTYNTNSGSNTNPLTDNNSSTTNEWQKNYQLGQDLGNTLVDIFSPSPAQLQKRANQLAEIYRQRDIKEGIEQKEREEKFGKLYYYPLMDRAEKGDYNAKMTLYYASYELRCTQFVPLRETWLTQAYKNKNLDALLEVGKEIKEPKDKLLMLENAAKFGSADAMVMLGYWYSKKNISAYGGSYTGGENDKTALSWYEKAAEKNHPQALYYLGMIYKYGLTYFEAKKVYVKFNVIKDEKKAFDYFSKALENQQNISLYSRANHFVVDTHGDLGFNYNTYKELAIMYKNGKVVEKDKIKAIELENKYKNYELVEF